MKYWLGKLKDYKSIIIMLDETIEMVKSFIDNGYSDVEICSKLSLNWEEFWTIVEHINYTELS